MIDKQTAPEEGAIPKVIARLFDDGTPLSFEATDTTSVWQGYGYRNSDKHASTTTVQLLIPLNASEGQIFEKNGIKFEVAKPHNSNLNTQFPNSVFVKRISSSN
ncbi:MAG: hypothetical protein UR39_C0002G0031 [Candidatus Woesebacteria bacterium GW2011_GWA1_33_30]|uniref:Uncharacterized protein n=1 Tax=Candidatus Woesebacteria bacterium GW2011_GWA2_33_28 TaxID=1618561 RepID=A0A0F9ZU96_9BACT|nr:MAG: hypothetical protein UR38_C0002G0031 [Candidatus Woesebacteria bacterium GW2011_GWA2_33_28]KKP48741.1 MAG: hypothetical protein UR39_C0002G0031 [Candidatus Woesebacteria bacterium GW2011_GWA1_33_30]KKP50014.1 MAG: hypothetical protein UR40_C0002G0031 [Microgenomates group bacterium GW2011_GWC1_33_32]KKP51785.1 MAG: hypothetical protein UR44_C0006G0031 [Candidatus Woesebacteria bacterium GW2011_GWB1_33_38]KKP58601.1 MAG: hypothetical protein UR48_C0003G0028 [Microgenomates group bacteriu